jgi:hypothetical protein
MLESADKIIKTVIIPVSHMLKQLRRNMEDIKRPIKLGETPWVGLVAD